MSEAKEVVRFFYLRGLLRSPRDSWEHEVGRNQRTKQARYHFNLKVEVYRAYGGACACCGEDELHFLSIDHVHNDGAAHRKQLQKEGQKLYLWLKRNNYPSGFQVLCMNCNLGKQRNGGVCPHQLRLDYLER